ncbi:portal protein [Sphingomonas albertensis]|uniref:portal protein n=1 Tax=Sphingomonas albertensis TaxID=2762591 RepID=UPI0037D9FD37
MADSDEPTAPKRETTSERNAKVHERAMQRFDAIWGVVREERMQNLADRRFARIRGAQWEGQYAIGEICDDNGDPIDTGAPRMEVPKFLRPIRRVKGEYRSSRKQVDFKPKGDDSDRASADNLDGLYRADMLDSPGGFGSAQDNAFDEAIDGGLGGWRLRDRWEDDEDEANENQRIGFEPIYDADQSMFFDLDAKHQDKSDARFAFLLTTLSRDAFEEKYPDATPSTFDGVSNYDYDWIQADNLTLAEYFEVEDRSVLRRTFQLKGINTLVDDVRPPERTFDDAELKAERDDQPTLEDELAQQGYEQIKQRRIKRQIVRRYLLTGAECLEGPTTIPGKFIPIIPLYAERSYVQGIERAQGMVRPAIDATRLYNIVVSNLAESASGPSDDTPIVAPEQVDSAILDAWASRKVKRPAVLLLKPIYAEDGTIIQAGMSGTLPAAQVSPATAALIQVAGADIPDLMGMNDQPETVPSNTSAAAIELVNDRGDVTDFLWHDNFSLALTHCGRVWLGMASELYVEEGRKMVSLDAEGKQSMITLAEPRTDDGGEHRINDLTTGKYDVVVDVGPATKTRQDATVKSMTGLASAYTANGNAANADAALGVAVINMEGEGTEAFRSFVRKQGLQAGWVEPSEEEAQQLAEAAAAAGEQQDPNMIIAQSQLMLAQAEQTKAQVALIEAETKRMTAEANAEKAKAETAAALATIDRDDRKQVLDEVERATNIEHTDEKHQHDRTMGAVDASMRVEQHERQMNQPEKPNGNAA